MFISALDLFKIGIGPSSSHTLGPMIAANDFINRIKDKHLPSEHLKGMHISCTFKGSLAFTGKGHASDCAVALGLHGYLPAHLTDNHVADLVKKIWQTDSIHITKKRHLPFKPDQHIIFDKDEPLPQHPNGMVFNLIDHDGNTLYSKTYFSIGGGFINTLAQISQLEAPLKMMPSASCSYPFDSGDTMLQMAKDSHISIAHMKRINELEYLNENILLDGIDKIWQAMQTCIQRGLSTEGTLPGGLNIARRAKHLFQDINNNPNDANINDYLCAYAMAVNEENAAGNMVVTAPTNGAAGVIPAVLYYWFIHEPCTKEHVHDFLLTASAIGGLIKHRSSISGAEVGCQGEVGSAAAMAAAGLCAVRGGTAQQIENAAEIALEHHLGMTCDPVNGLVQVPCIERNGFGAIKAYTAASLALRGSGQHFMSLDNCIAAMRQTGLDMSYKYKETALGGLAVSITEC